MCVNTFNIYIHNINILNIIKIEIKKIIIFIKGGNKK
jgi:hypothetical protein